MVCTTLRQAVARGGCNVVVKARNVQRAGADFAVIYSTEGTDSQHHPSGFVGCFKNDVGATRLDGFEGQLSFSACKRAAEARRTVYFAMEHPQVSSTPGVAQCLVLASLPQHSKAADSECAHERDTAGNRLGGANRLAVYATNPGAVVAMSGGGCFERNVDYVGNDLRAERSASATDCQKRCQGDARCSHFSLRLGTCHLKTSARGRAVTQGAISGSKWCLPVKIPVLLIPFAQGEALKAVHVPSRSIPP